MDEQYRNCKPIFEKTSASVTYNILGDIKAIEF